MPIYRNNNPAEGRYCVSPDGRIVYHEQSQKTKAGWREAEQVDIDAAPIEQLIKCGYLKSEIPRPADEGIVINPARVQATGTIE